MSEYDDWYDYWYDDYSGSCEQDNCGNPTYGGNSMCQECRELDTEMNMIESLSTKGQRREARRERGRMGMVKHLPGSFRPAKMPKGKVNYR